MQSSEPLTRLWSEYITARPTSNPVINALLLGMVVWTSGLVVYAPLGLAVAYLDTVSAYAWIAYIPLMIFGFQYFHRAYIKKLRGFRPHLKVTDEAFDRLLRRLDLLLCNRWIVFISAVLLAGYFELTNHAVVRDPITNKTIPLLTPLQALVNSTSEGRVPSGAIVWGTGQSYLSWLLLATGVWLVISIWIGIFLVSRQPLNFTPARFSNEFHDLAILNLMVTGFYFLGLSIPGLLNYLSESASKSFDPLSLAFFYILIGLGAVGFFSPHYNIHRTLVKGKNDELARIDKEMNQYASRLHELALNKSEELQEYVKLSSRLIALGANERRIAEADDWPLDHGQISTFLILIVVPIILNLITNPLP